MSAHAVGLTVGVAKKAELVVVMRGIEVKEENRIYEKLVHALIAAADDIMSKGLIGKAVVNMSFGTYFHQMLPPAYTVMRKWFIRHNADVWPLPH
jgi:hypothetical protein